MKRVQASRAMSRRPQTPFPKKEINCNLICQTNSPKTWPPDLHSQGTKTMKQNRTKTDPVLHHHTQGEGLECCDNIMLGVFFT